MRPGDVIADRFEIEASAGAGGMGQVYRARDRRSGEVVALKVLLDAYSLQHGRFSREAQVLAELRHPGIVRYVAHGVTPTGEQYLAMEWLKGEDLASRLERGVLTVEETVELGRRVAEALSVVHARGVVHRDLKPGNLFLVERDIERVKVLDFGVARIGDATPMTTVGDALGTPGYMAPEQARSGQVVDARADVFALGCVLFECLTGAPVFAGAHAIAVLAKIVFEAAPRLRHRRFDIPPLLDALCARMLAKDRDERPEDGAAVAAALSALGMDTPPPTGELSASLSIPPSSLTGSERRVLSVVLLGRDRSRPSGVPGEPAEEPLEEVVETHGGALALLADGSAIVTIAGAARVATDQAAQAARCALALRALPHERPMVLATGRAEVAGRLPVGELIDQAARMLARLTLASPGASSRATARPVAIDDVTAGLLDARFDVEEGALSLELSGEHEVAEGARTLLGKPTPCVGRDRELALLEASVGRSIEEGTAGVVLVTAAAGMGKSRMRYELIRRLRERDEAVEIWIARGDPLTAGSAFGLLAQALRGAIGIREGEPLSIRRRRLSDRVAARFSGDPGAEGRIAAFLGELVGTPLSDEDNVQLRAARRDPLLMGDQIRRAFEEFLAAECAAQPVLLVLEDLHWGDLPTVKLIHAALRNLCDQPFCVLSLARPEVHTIFPDLWAGCSVQSVRLGELGRKAAERLCRLALGDEVSAETVRATVERADGNAFFLEELIRAVAHGEGGALPETVLSMVQVRLEGFDPEARRVLRAASIFGETFWEGGVSALLASAEVAGWLSFLEVQEVISLREEATRFPGEVEYAFHHTLVQEAAYGMLTARDREVGHQLAGAWLEQAGEQEAGLLGEHFERGGEPGRALVWYRRAAEQALEGDDLGEALRWTARVTGGALPGDDADAAIKEELGLICRIEAEAHRLRGELPVAEARAREAMRLLPRGRAPWFAAVSEVAILCGQLGHTAELIAIGVELRDLWSPEAESAQIIATAWTAAQLAYRGEYALVDELLERLSTDARDTRDPQARARILRAQVIRAGVRGDAGRRIALGVEAVEQFVVAGDRRNACSARINLAFGQAQIGAWEEAERQLREALAVAERMGIPTLVAHAQHNLGLVLAHRGALPEALAVEREALERYTAHGDTRLFGSSRTYLALIVAQMGDLSLAEQEATRAALDLEGAPSPQAYALAIRAKVKLAQGRSAEALVDAGKASQMLRDLGGLEEGESLVRLVYAEALYATGQIEEALAALAAARGRVLALANKIVDPALRRSFLERMPDNARTLELSRAWLREEGDADLLLP
jgi:eukaryotic-like serine/threonine-protein kinase